MPDRAGLWSVRARWGYITALVVLLSDQLTKHWASAELVYRQPVPITSWFDLTLAHNAGAAFSFLAGAGGWQRWFFAMVAVLVSAVMVGWLARLGRERRWLGFALGLVLGGGLGNLWDRLALGYVVDFLSVHYHQWYWPAFNVADSAISVGAILLVLDSFYTAQEGTQSGSGDSKNG